MKNKIITRIVKYILMLLLIVGFICLFFIPTLYDTIIKENDLIFNKHSIYYIVGFYMCYLISLSVLATLTYLFNKIQKESPFSKKISRLLNIISLEFILLFVIVIIKNIFTPSIVSIAIGFICFIVSLSFYVLKEIFNKAIEYKNEVDYTI